MSAIPNYSSIKWVAFALCWLPLIAFAQTEPAGPGPERIVWKKTPIAIPLVVGEERLVHFPDSVSLGLPPSLIPVLRSQSINGTLYLLARQSFETTRVIVRSETGGPLYVLDLSAEPQRTQKPPLPDVQVLLETPKVADSTTISTVTNSNRPLPWGYVALTRYAAQQLYAPERLIPNEAGVVTLPVNAEPVDLVRGGQVDAVPVASWKAGLQYVTAVKLTNRTAKAVVLDPRKLRGAWLAATFQHNRLLPAGNDADTTVVYLVSDRPVDTAH